MSELAIAECIVRCIDYGTKLALGFYELSAKVQSPPLEITSLARDITAFCSVLRQIEVVLKDETSYSLTAEALGVLARISSRIDECLEDVQEVEHLMSMEISQPRAMRMMREPRAASPIARKTSPTASPDDKRKAWKLMGIGSPVVSAEDNGATLVERLKWHVNRPKTALVRQELECISIFLQLMVAIVHMNLRLDTARLPFNGTRDTVDIVAESLILAHEVSIRELSDAELLYGQSTLTKLRSKAPPSLRKDSAIDASEPTAKPAVGQTSEFLREATACQMQDLSMPLAPSLSQASVKTTLLSAKWTIANRSSQAVIAKSRALELPTSSARSSVSENAITPLRSSLKQPRFRKSKPQLARFSFETSSVDIITTPARTNLSSSASISSAFSSSSVLLPASPTSLNETRTLCSQCSHLFSACSNLTLALEASKIDYQILAQKSVDNQEALLKLLETKEQQVTNLTEQCKDQAAGVGTSSAEVTKLYNAIRELRDTEEKLKDRIASEKAQRLRAVQLLSSRMSADTAGLQRSESIKI